MWQEDDRDIQWSKKSREHTGGPHPDYDRNLLMARNFIHKVTSSLKSTMKISIEGTHGLENSVVMIAWNPGRYAPMGRWANGVCLHQAQGAFAKALENVFNEYIRKVEAFEKKYGSKYYDD